MQRIYCPDLNISEKTLTLKDEKIVHQLVKVLRSKKGDNVIFFNGKDNFDYVWTIDNIDKKEVKFVLFDTLFNKSEIDFTLNLYQALPNKLEKIEYLLQKGTEVGFSGFYFYRAERSQNLNLSENKIERLKKIIIETTEQSERTKIPELVFGDKISFVDLKDDENVFFHLKFSPEMPLPQGEKNDLKSLKIDYKKRVNIFVGPEGGFTETEAKTFELNNFKNINLGSRILRAETVGIVSGFYIIQNK